MNNAGLNLTHMDLLTKRRTTVRRPGRYRAGARADAGGTQVNRITRPGERADQSERYSQGCLSSLGSAPAAVKSTRTLLAWISRCAIAARYTRCRAQQQCPRIGCPIAGMNKGRVINVSRDRYAARYFKRVLSLRD